MSLHRLAIVIPAYKPDYFDRTLSSIVIQTNRAFTLYVGDDCSPYDIKSIVDRYEPRLDIIYKRFETNLGGENLVAQWERCVAMIRDEEWFCLFSDDDIMSNNFVEEIYNFMNMEADVLHANIHIIDENDNVLRRCNPYPKHLNVAEYYRLVFARKLDSRMPEFVFRTDSFKQRGGFVFFDMAICSDNATVMNQAFGTGIHTIPNACVFWRTSGKSLSSMNSNKALIIRREAAFVNFLDWSRKFFAAREERYPLDPVHELRLLLGIIKRLSPVDGFASVIRRTMGHSLMRGVFGRILFFPVALVIYCVANVSSDEDRN